MRLFSFLKHPAYLLVFVGAAFLVFDVHWYLMATLPGHRDDMCIPGGNFTLLNTVFALLMALLFGLLVVGFAALFKGVVAPGHTTKSVNKKIRMENRRFLAAHSFLGGVGTVFGFLTVFCTACAIPVISLLGLSVSFQAFALWLVQYELILKLLSLVFLVAACWFLNRQLEKRCLICAQ